MNGAWLAGFFLMAANPPGVLVDRIVAVVNKQVVTHSELLTEARVALALRAGDDAAVAHLSGEFLDSFREYLVNELLVARQARRLGGEEVADDDVDRALQQLQASFRSNDAYQAFLRRFDIQEEVIRNILRRNVQNRRFIAQRMRLRTLGAPSDGSAGDNYNEALSDWLRELRQLADILLPGPDGTLERP